MTRHHSCRVSPFGHPRIHARLTAPRGISQPPTSFIGSQCQGIHHAPLNTYNKNQKCKNKLHKQNTVLLVRCSQPLSTNQTPHPTTKTGRQHTHPTRGDKPACCLRTQQCVWQFFTTNAFQPAERLLSYAPAGAAHYRRRRQSQPPSPALLRGWGKPWIRACKWCSLERR